MNFNSVPKTTKSSKKKHIFNYKNIYLRQIFLIIVTPYARKKLFHPRGKRECPVGLSAIAASQCAGHVAQRLQSNAQTHHRSSHHGALPAKQTGHQSGRAQPQHGTHLVRPRGGGTQHAHCRINFQSGRERVSHHRSRAKGVWRRHCPRHSGPYQVEQPLCQAGGRRE